MWHEYQIPANFEKQKGIIRRLRKWIQSLENNGLIIGYAFNHYFEIPTNPKEPDELRIRFEYSHAENRDTVEKELVEEVKKDLPDYSMKERPWDFPQHILQAYEFGSRCAFLAWELIENKRFPEDYFSHFFKEQTEKGMVVKQIPQQFQTQFSHGAMNSLGIWKSPDELLIHLDMLMDCTNTHTKQELIEWLQENLKGQ